MNLTKETKPHYITVVSHFQARYSDTDLQAFMEAEFEKFDKKVNEKIKEGYTPHGSLAMDHCDTASMDLAQVMVLEATE